MRILLKPNKGTQTVIVAFMTMAVFFALNTVSFAEVKTIATKSMTYEKCIVFVASIADDLGIIPITIVDTDMLMIARFLTNDGSGISFLASCSRPDRKFVLTQSALF